MNGRRHLGPITRPAELASWVMMGNTQKAKSTLVIEGSSDSHALIPFANGETCRIIVAEGKENVLAAMDLMRSARYAGVLAVVDSDFDRLEGRDCAPEDIAHTDTHDLETMMLCTEAFRKVLLRNRYFKEGRVEIDVQRFDQVASELLGRLLNSGCRLGYLRWASHRHNLRINFDCIELAKVVDPSTLVIREDRLEEAILRASSAAAGSWTQINALADALVAAEHDRWQICNGHDLTGLLALHLSRSTGSPVTRKSVEADLAAAYATDDFRRTQVFARILDWQRRNPPRRILR
ncbi:MAG: DUF4435 domain-containing protein [Bryobacteraceae bacterium]